MYVLLLVLCLFLCHLALVVGNMVAGVCSLVLTVLGPHSAGAAPVGQALLA